MPDGPDSMADLFNWPQRYAQKVLGNLGCSDGNLDLDACKACISLLSKDICLHEQYAGLGTAGWTLKQCVQGLRDQLLHLAGDVACASVTVRLTGSPVSS